MIHSHLFVAHPAQVAFSHVVCLAAENPIIDAATQCTASGIQNPFEIRI